MLQVLGVGSRGYFLPTKVPTLKENGDKKKNESAVMVVNQDSELIAEAKIDKNDEGGTTCFTGAFSATYGRGSDVLTLLLTATAATKRGHA